MITELLKSINKQLEELNGLLKDSDYLKELENKIEIVNKSINREHQENILLKHRVEKAIEYIEQHTNRLVDYLDVFEVHDLVNILQGVDKE